MGLYSVLWGKYKEYQEKEGELIILPEVSTSIFNVQNGVHDVARLQTVEENNDIEMQKDNGEPNTNNNVDIRIPPQQTSIVVPRP